MYKIMIDKYMMMGALVGLKMGFPKCQWDGIDYIIEQVDKCFFDYYEKQSEINEGNIKE